MATLTKRGLTPKASKGFTLIELLVVIAIIGLLASIVIASLSSARSKGRDARRVADIKSIQLALEMFYDANGMYATSTAFLVPTYISKLPTDPSSPTTNYAYAALQGTASAATTCGSYHLAATLENNNTTGPLAGDADATVLAPVCTNGGASPTDFLGPDPVYDVKP